MKRHIGIELHKDDMKHVYESSGLSLEHIMERVRHELESSMKLVAEHMTPEELVKMTTRTTRISIDITAHED